MAIVADGIAFGVLREAARTGFQVPSWRFVFVPQAEQVARIMKETPPEW